MRAPKGAARAAAMSEVASLCAAMANSLSEQGVVNLLEPWIGQEQVDNLIDNRRGGGLAGFRERIAALAAALEEEDSDDMSSDDEDEAAPPWVVDDGMDRLLSRQPKLRFDDGQEAHSGADVQVPQPAATWCRTECAGSRSSPTESVGCCGKMTNCSSACLDRQEAADAGSARCPCRRWWMTTRWARPCDTFRLK